MIDLIKVFIEEAFKLLDIPKLLKARKQTELAKLGADLFALYSSLNKIIVMGNRIVDRIEGIIEIKERYEKEGRVDEPIPALNLIQVLEQQGMNLAAFSGPFVRLAGSIDVIHPDASRKMMRFLSIKTGAITFLTAILRNPEKIPLFAVKPEQAREGQKPKSVTLAERISAEDVKTLKRYLKQEDPRRGLAQLEGIARELHKALTDNFKIEDVLLAVGDTRAAEAPGVWDDVRRQPSSRS
jgi:hypothetical protein